ncbi:MAG: polyhydroxyalkanoate synthesis repressor PhaR [Pseudomonadota bacterium]
MAGEKDNAKIVIKKYANRRLYNTAKSSYVTLDDLSQMVRHGEDFAVFDAKSGEDITRSVLTQIIVEEEGKDQNMLPTKFLRELIRLYGDPLQGVVPSYLDAAMDAFNRNQDQMRQAFTGGNAFANLESMTRANMDFFEKSMRVFAPFSAGTEAGTQDTQKPQAAAAASPKADVSDDLEALQKQMQDMQEQIKRLTKDKD